MDAETRSRSGGASVQRGRSPRWEPASRCRSVRARPMVGLGKDASTGNGDEALGRRRQRGPGRRRPWPCLALQQRGTSACAVLYERREYECYTQLGWPGGAQRDNAMASRVSFAAAKEEDERDEEGGGTPIPHAVRP